MTTAAGRAMGVIRGCVASDRYAVSLHFSQRMQERGLFWGDVQTVIENPADVRSQGRDRYDRPKWVIHGEAADGQEIEIVCAIETDESGVEFITIYWEN